MMKSYAMNTAPKGNHKMRTRDHELVSLRKMAVHFKEGAFLTLR